jgi:hypothetical protein
MFCPFTITQTTTNMSNLDDDKQMMIVEAACYAIVINQQAERTVIEERERPSYLWKPKLSIDGNQWCALFGENLQDGVAGFGDTPAKAMLAFDRAWKTPLPNAQIHTSPHEND